MTTTQFTAEPDIVYSLQQVFDINWRTEIRQLSRYLTPEWLAAYSGFKKLVEKDFRNEEEPQSLLLHP